MIKNIILERFTASKLYSYIDESVVDNQVTNMISITNCTFVESQRVADSNDTEKCTPHY